MLLSVWRTRNVGDWGEGGRSAGRPDVAGPGETSLGAAPFPDGPGRESGILKLRRAGLTIGGPPAPGTGHVARQAKDAASLVRDNAFEHEALGLIDRLYATALRLTRQPADAEDLVQDTYLRAFRSADRFEPGTNLRGWLFTILHNAFLNQLRDRGRSPIDADSDVVEQAPDVSGWDDTPEEQLLRNTMDEDLRAELDGLPDVFREAVWLRDVEQFTYDEIANIVGVPIGTVMSRISRGRRLLHDRLVARSERFARMAGTGGLNRAPGV
jgi:RNA polymerase sigma-70 factor (ECF subfamily)